MKYDEDGDNAVYEYDDCLGGDSFDINRRLKWHVDFDDNADSEEGHQHAELLSPNDDPTERLDANVVSSLSTQGFQYPALDLDQPIVLIESSTPGHHHLYFPTIALTTEQYAKLLDVLCECGIVQRFWADRIHSDGQTVLRMPGVKKGRP